LADRDDRTVINIPISKPFRPTAVRVSVALLGIFSGLLLALVSGWYLKHKFDQKYEIVLS
jgi:hypothetical protein